MVRVVRGCAGPAEGSPRSLTNSHWGHQFPDIHLFLGRLAPHWTSCALSPRVGQWVGCMGAMPWAWPLGWEGDTYPTGAP